ADQTGTLVGRVLLSNGTLPRTAELRVTWQADYNHGQPIVAGGGPGVTIQQGDRRITPDPYGRFLVCGVAFNRPIHVRLADQSLPADTTVFVSADPGITSLQWRATLHAPVGAPTVVAAAPPKADAPPLTRAMEVRRRARPAVFLSDSVLHHIDHARLGDVL